MKKLFKFLVAVFMGFALASCSVVVQPVLSGVEINKEATTLEVGQTETLTATIKPELLAEEATTIRWSTSDNTVASVNDSGLVTALKEGTATIKVTVTSGRFTKEDTCLVTVVQPVSGVTLDKTSASLKVGDNVKLTPTVLPNNATNKAVTWATSDSNVATVNDGLVSAIKSGSATITVTTVDGNKKATCTITVIQPVSGVVLDKQSHTLNVGENFTLTATVNPADADNKEVTWSSSNTSVATVNNGVVTAVKAGTTTITVKTVDGNKEASCVVTVLQPVTGVTLDSNTLALLTGEHTTLVATVLPADASNKAVTWASSNTNVATVNAEGKVVAVGPGSATVTVTTVDGSKTSTCTVTVTQPVTSVTLNKQETTIVAGETESLVATVNPSNASNKQVTWTSSNESVATVNQNGLVTAKGLGSAVITVTTVDGNKTATCTVTVIRLVESVSLDKTTHTMDINTKYTLVATVLPADATNKQVTWTSSNSDVVTVNNGEVTAVGKGSAVITVTTVDGNKTATCTIRVLVPVTGVTLDKEEATLETNKTLELVATVLPTNATNKEVVWTTSDKLVATVENGVVKGIAPGEAVITVTTVDGEFEAECLVTVIQRVNEVKLPTSLTLVEGSNPSKLTATVLPANATNKAVTWDSSNKQVATVDAEGNVTPVGLGSTVITVTTVDGGLTATCTVTVVELEIPATDVEIEGDKDTLYVDETLHLVAVVTPLDTTDSIVWSTSDENVATVGRDGLVTALSAGEVVITVTVGNVEATYEITVNKISLEIEDLEDTEITFGEEYEFDPTISSNQEIKVEYYLGNVKLDEAPVNAGEYVVKATALANNKYAEVTATVTLVINKAKVKIPVANEGLVYTGEELVGVESNDLYTVVDGSATNAETYVATVTLKDLANYEWAEEFDGNVLWTIGKATFDMSNVSWVYEGPYTYDGLAHGVTLKGLPEGLEVKNYINASATNAGTYTAGVEFVANNNYYPAEVETKAWVINKAKLDMQDAEWNYSEAFNYDGNKHSVVLVNVPEEIEVTYTDNEATNAGTYVAVAEFSWNKDNYEVINNNVESKTWVIKPAVREFEVADLVVEKGQDYEVKYLEKDESKLSTYVIPEGGTKVYKVNTITEKIEGTTGTWEGMHIDATNGKWAPNNSSWAQINKGTIITFEIPLGAEVEVGQYTQGSFEVEIENTTCTITALANDYISTITVTTGLPTVTESTRIDVTQSQDHFEGSAGVWGPLSVDATNGKWKNNNGGWVQVNQGTVISFNTVPGSHINLTPYSSKDNFEVVEEDGLVTITLLANDYLRYIDVYCPKSLGENDEVVYLNEAGQEVAKPTEHGKYTVKVTVGVGTNYVGTKEAKLTIKTSATSVELSKEETTIYVGEKEEIEVTILPANTSEDVVITSTDEEVATMDIDGLIKAGTKVGTTTITVTCGEYSDSITVSVVNPWGTEEEPISADEAIELLDRYTKVTYSPVKGYIEGVVASKPSYNSKYSSYTFNLVENNSKVEFVVYSANLASGVNEPVVGDIVLVSGWFVNYSETKYEIANSGNTYPTIISVEKPKFDIELSVKDTNGNDTNSVTVVDLEEKAEVNTKVEFTIENEQNYILIVTVNDVELTPVEGTYSFTITEATSVNVIVVEGDVNAESITIEGETTVELDQKTLTLVGTTVPYYATETKTWTSSDESIATVNNGVVTLKKAGTVTITVTTGTTNKEDTHELTITNRWGTEDNPISVETALELIDTMDSGSYSIKGYVTGVVSSKPEPNSRGNYIFEIVNVDTLTSTKVFKVYSGVSATAPNIGDVVVVSGYFTYSYSTYEVTYSGSNDCVIESISHKEYSYTVEYLDSDDSTFVGAEVVGLGETLTSGVESVFTVTVPQGYEVNKVKFNKATITPNENGEYTIKTALENIITVIVVAEGSSSVEPTEPAWTLVTNASELEVGDEIVVVAINANYALGTKQNTNNRGVGAVVKDEETVTFGNDVQVITLEAGTKANTFAFNVGNGYLYAASTSSNYLKTTTTLGDSASWTITISDGIATIKAQQSARNWLRYNPNTNNNNPLFSCYTSGQEDVAIYKYSTNSGSEVETPTCEHTNTTTTTVEATCTQKGSTTVTCVDCGEVVGTPTEIPMIDHADVNTDDDHDCDVCGATNITRHEYVGGVCNCGEKEEVIETKSGWILTDLVDIQATDLVVIVWTTSDGKSYALSANAASSKAPAVVSVTVADEKLNSNITDDLKWNISNSTGNLTIYSNGTTDKWLYCTNDNNGVRVGTSDNKTFVIDADSGYLKHTATNRYLGVYNSQDVRCYSSSTGQNIKNQTLSFYKFYQGSSSEPVCEHTNKTTETVDATCTEVGSVTTKCADCGVVFGTEEIPAKGHTYVGGVCSCGEQEPQEKWILVTDVNDLAAGDKVVIVAKDYDYALSTDQRSNNRGQAAVTKDGNTVTFGADVQVLTLEAGTVANTFAFNTGSGYLCAASSSSNYLRTETTLSANSSWTIEIANDGTAVIVAQGSYTRNTMQYNQGSSLFACYGSASQKAVCIYKLG